MSSTSRIRAAFDLVELGAVTRVVGVKHSLAGRVIVQRLQLARIDLESELILGPTGQLAQDLAAAGLAVLRNVAVLRSLSAIGVRLIEIGVGLLNELAVDEEAPARLLQQALDLVARPILDLLDRERRLEPVVGPADESLAVIALAAAARALGHEIRHADGDRELDLLLAVQLLDLAADQGDGVLGRDGFELLRPRFERELLVQPAAQRAAAELFVGEDGQRRKVEPPDRFEGPPREVGLQRLAGRSSSARGRSC